MSPTARILTLAQDLARLGGRCLTGVQVEPDQVEGALPDHRSARAPGRVDLLQLLAARIRQRPGRRLHRQSLGTPLLVLGSLPGGGPRVLSPDTHRRALERGVQRRQEAPVLLGPPARGGQALLPRDVEVRPDHAELLQLFDTAV